ncbi:ATP-binding protein [Agarivorans aestuarii]|uniref:ATP-binding protein n=1 Tax=Agarivorans aestuarii TaxID=1563703 RepID=UPI001C7EC194|nr:sensor histidine kinase [Agarivorans aestuarii]
MYQQARLPSYRARLLLIMLIYSLIQLSIVVVTSYWYVSDSEYQDKGERALDVARVVAKLPDVVSAVERRDSANLQPLAEELRRTMGASFIVVGDVDGIRLAHPKSERIGKPMVGGDNHAALVLGQEYVSQAKGSLGVSVRGKVPVKDQQGQIIGIVSVGYLLEKIDVQLQPYLHFMVLLVMAVLSLNMLIGWWLAQRIKDTLLGFEPEQMTRLYAELQATLNTIREGVIAINREGIITNVNANAIRLLGKDLQGKSISPVGLPLRDWLPDSDMAELLDQPQAQSDVELLLNGHLVIANRVPMRDQQQNFIGMVSSFRRKDEITLLTKQLSQIKAHSEALRVQNHEHSNQLNTIAGLIQLGESDKALSFIGQANDQFQELIRFLIEAVEDSVIAGCILGKFHRARELGLTLNIDPDSSLRDLPAHCGSEQIVTIVANLLDNAFEATRASNGREPINLSMTDLGNDIIIEVEDFAGGIQDNLQANIYEQGVTTKTQGDHGIGLYLVKETVQILRGNVEFSSDNLGTRFTVYIPKQLKQE